MNIQAEKLQLIEWLAKVNDIKIVEEIKALKRVTDKDLFKRYTGQDLINRAEDSIEDIEAGRTAKLADFLTEIEHWKRLKNTK